MKKLNCKIFSTDLFGNHNYVVKDGDEIITEGTSSSLRWVKHDAGGYHTKEKFDELYPEGWEVEFSF